MGDQEQQQEGKWESPGQEDIAAALDKAGLGVEAPPEPKEPPAEAPKVEEPGAEEKPEEKPPEEAAEPEAPQTVNIDGVDYTMEELREFRRRGMFQADYTKKTQALAEERRELQREREDFEARQRTGVPEGAAPGTARRLEDQANRLQKMLDDPEVPESVREAILLQREETQAMLAEMRRRDLQAREDQRNTEAMNVFETTFSELCAKHKVVDPLDKDFLEAKILKENPDTTDLTELRASVQRIFEHAHKGLVQRIEKARREGVKALAQLPVPPPQSKGGSAVPLKPEPKPPATLDDGSAPQEFHERLSRLRGLAT